MPDLRTLLLVCGSTRARSTNRALLQALVDAPPAGARCVLDLSVAHLPPFDPDTDPVPADVVAMRQRFADADAVLFCTPEYAGALPGTLKNLLDWTVGGAETAGLPTGWINVSAAPRGQGAHAELATVAAYTELVVVPQACARVEVPRSAVGEDGSLLDTAALAAAQQVLRTLLSAC